MTLTVTITETEVCTAARAFLLDILPDGYEVFRGQDNRVPEPTVSNFVIMTPMSRPRLATNTDTWDETDDVPGGPTTKQIETDIEFRMQLDIHGPGGSDAATLICATFFDEYARASFYGTGIEPLYATDGNQIPFINGEKGYENRWVMVLAMQIKPVVSTPMQFADTLTTTVIPVIGGP